MGDYKQIRKALKTLDMVDHHHAVTSNKQRKRLTAFSSTSIALGVIMEMAGLNAGLTGKAQELLLGGGAGLAAGALTRRRREDAAGLERKLLHNGVHVPQDNPDGAYWEHDGSKCTPPRSDEFSGWNVHHPSNTDTTEFTEKLQSIAAANHHLSTRDSSYALKMKSAALGAMVAAGGVVYATHDPVSSPNPLTDTAETLLLGLGAGLGASAKRRSFTSQFAAEELLENMQVKGPYYHNGPYALGCNRVIFLYPPTDTNPEWSVVVRSKKLDEERYR